MKLLVTLLDAALSAALPACVSGRGPLAGLFCGRHSYVITCSSCSVESAGSAVGVDIHELELNVAGFSTLEASLADMLSEEALTGDNQYACEAPACRGARRDATRVNRLRVAPAVLSLHLKRFVYDRRTCARKKITAKFAFPQQLDMQPLLRPTAGVDAPADGAQYDLAAVVMHKGSAATSGHYSASPYCFAFWR